jgi:similar to spore coat protein
MFGLHETLELHEITTFKTVCMTKSTTMQALVSDPDLKDILQQDVQLSSRQLQELNGLLSKAINLGGK